MDSSNASEEVPECDEGREDVEVLRLQSSVPDVEKRAFEIIHSSMVEWETCGNSSVHREVSFNVSAINASDANVVDLCAEDEDNNIEISLNANYTEKTLDTRRMSVMLAALHDSREMSRSLTNTSQDLEKACADKTRPVAPTTAAKPSKDPASTDGKAPAKAKRCCLQIPAKIIAGKEVNESNASLNAATSPLFTVAAAEIRSPTSYEDFVPSSRFQLYMTDI